MKELIEIQSTLNAPKNKRNSFGNYNYRSCEDILEAVKPLLKANGCTLTLSDEMVCIGNRIYVKATATLTNSSGEKEIVYGWARESEQKKGMDDSQVTGATSSYARKYALNGLFAIDDNKDADTDEYAKQQNQKHNESDDKEEAFKDGVINALPNIKSIDDLTTMWNKLDGKTQADSRVKAAFSNRKGELTYGK